MFEDWPPECRSIAERLRPMLCRNGAAFYPVNIPRQARVGWPKVGGKKHSVLAVLSCAPRGTVDLDLRVSRHSGFIEPDGPLKPSSDQSSDSQRDFGRIRLSAEFPADLPAWMDNAFQHCVERYGIELEQGETESGFALPDEVPPDATHIEGAVRTITVNAYERDPQARRKCIAAHGTRCCVCESSLAEFYGAVADELIHVHHLRPLSEVGGAHHVDPVQDLRPVCPNCHAVLHRRVPAYRIEDVRAFIQKRRHG